MFVAICSGFCLMLCFSLFAYLMESRYVQALESRIATQQGQIYELERLLMMRENTASR